MAHSSPVMTYTTGTIRPTSTPIRGAVSGRSAIERSARPSFVVFSMIDRPKTMASDRIRLSSCGTENSTGPTSKLALPKGEDVVSASDPQVLMTVCSMTIRKPRELTSGRACSVASPYFAFM